MGFHLNFAVTQVKGGVSWGCGSGSGSEKVRHGKDGTEKT